MYLELRGVTSRRIPTILTSFRMGLFGFARRWGWRKNALLSKDCHTYAAMIILGTVMLYLRKIQKISRDTSLKTCESSDALLFFC